MFKFSKLLDRRYLRNLRDLLFALIARDFKMRYKRSTLGFAWALLTPVLQLLIYYFVFQLVLTFRIPAYPIYVFIGVISWMWFETSLAQASTSITGSGFLIRQPVFQSAVLPFVSVAINLINFLISLPVLWLLLLVSGVTLTATILYLPIIIVIQFVFTLGLSYFIAATNVIFRDVQHILGILLRLWFFLTPIFYDPGLVPEKYLALYNLNPLFHIVDAYRKVILKGAFPDLPPLCFVFVISLVILCGSMRFFEQMKFRFAEEL